MCGMAEEWTPDALIDQKLGQTKKEMMEYIEKNSENIDSNIPIFYGHVISILEKNFPHLPDQAYDRFIDDLTIKVLEESKRSTDVDYIERLFRHASRVKRKQTGRAIFDIVLGFKLIDIGKYHDAIEILKKYRTVDAIVCTAIAYAYYVLSSSELLPGEKQEKNTPSTMALNSREQMIELARLRPPVNRLRFPMVVQELRVNKVFWFMIRTATEWFPQEPEFIKIGLEKAKKDGNREMRGELLKIAAERYYNDMFFLRDLYHFKLESRDAGGATAVVRQMMQHIVLLMDFAYMVVTGRKSDAEAVLEDSKRKLPALAYYLETLGYMISDIFSEDEKRSKNARKVFLDSIDQYCLRLIKMKEY